MRTPTMAEAEGIEQACADAWPPLLDQRVGDWRLRCSDGFTGRANSALVVGEAGMPVSEALTRVCEFAHRNGIPPLAQVVAGAAIEAELADAGWRLYTEYRAGHEVSILLGPTGTGEPGDITVLDAPTPGWWELTVGTPEPTRAQRHVLATGPRTGFGVLERDGVTVGAVRGCVVGDLLLVARLAVRPDHRRRGLATALMAGIGDWGRGHGATRTVLQVAVDNAGALALYDRLGFAEHHRYRYWTPTRRNAVEGSAR